jgi:hypothetical protein
MVVNARCDGSTWINSSDRNLKENFERVNTLEVLEKVASLSLQTWSYKAQPGQKHLGPVAQDFQAAFALGNDGTSISTVDADGVALAAIQGLNQKLEEKEKELATLKNVWRNWNICLNRYAIKNMKRILFSFLLVALFLFCTHTNAQTYSIDWFTIDGGGGTSTGSVYSVSGTIGQPDAHTMSGGSFTLAGGFWGIIAAVQTPGAPLLSIARSNNVVVVSWPDSASGFRLENNSILSLTNGWSDAPQTRSTNAGTISIIIPSPTGNNFYRLKNP